MIKMHLCKYCLLLIFIWYARLCPSSAKYLAQIFANKCVREVWYLFPGDNPKPSYPSVVISLCHVKDPDGFLQQNESAVVKPQARFSPHSFLLSFSHVETTQETDIFQRFYEKLIISLPQLDLFHYNAKRYKLFEQFDAGVFKLEFLRSRWNLDEIVLYNSIGAYIRLLFHESQLPKALQKLHTGIGPKNLTFPNLYYNAISGYGQVCQHISLDVKLGSLTYNFNSYDRIFCDAFEYHGLKFDTYYNRGDMFHFRGKMIRDDLLSSFPPDGSNVVYFASPKLTFVVLQPKPDVWQWQFARRPFQRNLWIALVVAFGILELLKNVKLLLDKVHQIKLKRKMIRRGLFAMIVTEYESYFIAQQRFKNIIGSWNYFLRLLIMSAYSGMILVGILHPLYPWYPSTFKELNQTTNYYIGSAKASSEFIQPILIENYVVNGIKQEMFLEREDYPAPAYLISKAISEEKEDMVDKKFHAVALYDDKVNLWMKGRAFIHLTAPVLDRIVVSSDRVLPEIRYVSVAPGATRLHFLVETIRWVFTSGTWMRWYYLEENYYKNVAPVLAKKKLIEMGVNDTSSLEGPNKRSLTIQDIFSVFAINGIGLAVAAIIFQLETWKCMF